MIWSSFGRRLVTLPGIASIHSLLLAAGLIRETLTANRTYYVRTDGSDSNDGLANTAGGAFLTLQKAWNVIVTLDLGGFVATIQVGDGTYTSGIVSAVSPVGGSVTITGNSGTPTNVLISTTSATGLRLTAPCKVTINNLEMRTATSQGCIYADGGADITAGAGMVFGAVAEAHMRAGYGGIIRCGTYAVSGGGGYHWFALGGNILAASGTVTITGTPAFSVAWANVQAPCTISAFSMTFSGSATGKRYAASLNGVINSFGSGTTHFPGDVAGTTATGGQYA